MFKSHLTLADLAHFTERSPSYVARRFRTGDAPRTFFIGKSRVTTPQDAAPWIAKHRVRAP